MRIPSRCLGIFFLLLLVASSASLGLAQQVVQRGAFGKPAQVMDETQQWTTPLLMASDRDVEIYIPDVTTTDWLQRNYRDYMDKGQYVLTMFTFYKTPKACRTNMIRWGYSDANHLDQCVDISYRVRQATVETRPKSITLIMAAMVGEDGQVKAATVQHDAVSRTWADLDEDTREALEKATALLTRAMDKYDRKVQSVQ
jgi:hypothetical protein